MCEQNHKVLEILGRILSFKKYHKMFSAFKMKSRAFTINCVFRGKLKYHENSLKLKTLYYFNFN